MIKKDLEEKKEVEETEVEEKAEEIEEDTEETKEEDKTMEKLEKAIDAKVDAIISAVKGGKSVPRIKAQPVQKDRCVLNSDPSTRLKRPFLELSEEVKNFVLDLRRLAKGGVVSKAMNETVDEEGGFLVPEEFNAEVIRYASETAVVRPRARIVPMARDVINFPVLDQDVDQFGGVELHWIGESEEKLESQPAWKKFTLTAKKLIGLTAVSDELLEDSVVNVANFLVGLFGEAIAYEEDKQFLLGTGAGLPAGIIPNATNLVNRETAGEIKYIDLKKMMTALPSWADSGAVWVTTKAGLEKILNIKSGVYDGTSVDETKGMPLMLPGFSLASGVAPTILGYPYVLTDKLPSVGTKGDIILCNFSWYYIGDKGPLAVASSIHDRFRFDETVFRFVKRVDGAMASKLPFVVLDVVGA